ncbi:MAG: hypothetical protein ACKOFF_04615 [Acidimicrobiales bacterium]
MPDEPWGNAPQPQEDRLAALRGATGAGRSGTSTAPKQRMLRELVLGVTLLLLGAVVVLVFVSSRTGSTPTVDTVVSRDPGPLPAPLAPGVALVPALVERGSYPPDISMGDMVIVVVTPESGDGRPARVLNHDITVVGMSPDDSLSGGAVITLAGPEVLARDIADARRVHISVVAGGGK